ncbi:MAG: phenylalanine--tRNA ligase subunit beta [Kiritimatiellae bacterium]|nr:phenylalanine--tRNA ligase subunit beta [Kiritimatiellia bacterium]
MKLPLSWLDEYVKIDDIAPEELAAKLTRAGLQVESIETVGRKPLDDHFVVVEVLEATPHPDSDHLRVCKVTDGKETLQVVCGAPNMRQGIKTAFSKIGAIIPNGGFKIKKGKLRGVESFGMCYSSAELDLPGGNHDGIMEFPPETPTGAFLRDVLPGDKPETVFDIEVTWNRPDALSIVGLAREFGAILGRKTKLPAVDFTECDANAEDEISVEVLDAEKCPRYTARVVPSVEDGKSPDFMAKRLELCGMRSLGLVVDVTNYVMLELGQPMHAFDYKTLEGRKIVVRDAKEGETMKTLDGVERKLDPSMLMICDASRPNAVAGIMGGEESEIAEGTKSVLLESALFDPVSTKSTATKLGIASESAYRYIRGVDKDLADFASRRAAHLLQKYGNAKIARGLVDADSRIRPLNPDVSLDFARARRLIGMPIADAEMVRMLESLGLSRTGGEEGRNATFSIPSWRWDLTLEADLVEEIARLYGLDNIPDTMPCAPSISPLSDAPFKAKNAIRSACLALGFTEAMHYSFLSRKELDDFGGGDAQARLEIPDPVSAEYSVMRDSLLPQMASSLGRNASRQAESAMLFEIGKVFSRNGGTPSESERLCLGFFGPVGREALRRRKAADEEEALLWMKGAVEKLVAALRAGRVEFAACDGGCAAAFAPGACATVKINGRAAGTIGALSAKMRHPYRLSSQMVLCEIDLKPLAAGAGSRGKFTPAPQFPPVRRDVALFAEAGVSNAAIESIVRKNGGKLLAGISLFDIFSPKDRPGGRSFAYSLEFRSPERTLTDDEVGQTFRRIVDALKATRGIEVRES